MNQIKSDWYNNYLLNIYSMEYNIKLSDILTFINKLKHFLINDNLDIDFSYYYSELDKYRNELFELEKNNKINIDVYKSYISKISKLVDDIKKEYNPLTIVELFFKKICALVNDREASLDEIIKIKDDLIEYIIDLSLDDEEIYRKICEKYGIITDKTLIQYIEMATIENYSK